LDGITKKSNTQKLCKDQYYCKSNGKNHHFSQQPGSDINIGKKFLTVVFPDGLRNVRCDGQGQPKPDDMNSNKNI